MKTLGRLVLAVALAGAATSLPGCAVAQPVPAPYAEPPGAWEGELAPYGTWTSLPNYGTVWYPSVAPGWRPYLYGYWGWGPGGWTWFSSEPWGFTFHYGRWAWAPIGWVWVPGTVWGPAWVNWYWGAGYVGWAPLGYYGAVPWAQFVFVRDYDFGCRDTYNRYYRQPPKGGGYKSGPPPRQWVERTSHQPIVRVSANELPNRPSPGARGGNRTRGGGWGGGQVPARPGEGTNGPRGGNRAGSQGSSPGVVSRPPWDATPNARGGAQRPRYFSPSRGNAPDVRTPTGYESSGATPPRVGGNSPRAYAPRSPAPPPASAPPASPGRGYGMMPRGQSAAPSPPMGPTVAPAPSAPPSGFRGGFSPAPSGSGFTGGARGFGSGRGGGSPGMR